MKYVLITMKDETRTPKQKMEEVREMFGNVCVFCGTNEKVEFAHLRETGLNNVGRGSKHRRLDILKNLDIYAFLCKDCYFEFDKKDSLLLMML